MQLLMKKLWILTGLSYFFHTFVALKLVVLKFSHFGWEYLTFKVSAEPKKEQICMP